MNSNERRKLEIFSRSTLIKCHYIVPAICIMNQLLSIGLISWEWIESRNYYFHELHPNLLRLETSLLTGRNSSEDFPIRVKETSVSVATISQTIKHSTRLLNGMKCDGMDMDGAKDLWILGQPGHPGIRGNEGSKGEPGEMGPIGPKGEQGLDGIPGYPGDSGPQGNQGQVGAMGNKGVQGPPIVGAPGLIGLPGEMGVKGDRAPPGFPGLPGPQGVKGQKGLLGSIGQKGDTGRKGNVGREGPEGFYGSTGDFFG